MKAQPWPDAAIAALALIAVFAAGIAIFATIKTSSDNSPAQVVRAFPTATATGTAVPPPATLAPLLWAQVVDWVNSTPGPTPTPSPPPSRPDVRPCLASDLRVSDSGGQAYSMNQAATSLIFLNVSSSECKLSGVPGVEFVGPNGELLGNWNQSTCLPMRPDCQSETAVLEPDHSQTPIPQYAIRSSETSAFVFYLTGFRDYTGRPSPTPCPAKASSLRITLPDGSESLVTPFTIGTPCLIPTVGQFRPAPTISAAATARLFVGLTVPTSVAAGSTLKFLVKITNLSTEPYSFEDPCPNFEMLVYDLNLHEHHILNCRGLDAVPPGGTVYFAMEISIPADAEPGPHYLDWWADRIGGAEDDSTLGKTPYHVTVVSPS